MDPPIRAASGHWLPWCVVAATLLVSPADAGTDRDVPEGVPAGSAVFAPWFTSDVLADDNIFRRTADNNPVSDIVTTLNVGVGMYVPFRMSDLYIGYEGDTALYQQTNFEGTDSHLGTAILFLNFSSYDTLTIEGTYTDGITQLQTIDEVGELLRQGIPYQQDDWVVEWSRIVRHRPSYRARVGWSERTYSPDEEIPWLSYSGWDVEYEYRQPIFRRGDLTAEYVGRVYEQFESGDFLEITGPIRKEVYNGFLFGYRGLIGNRQPVVASVGYGQLGYRDSILSEPSEDFQGLIGRIAWRLPVGGRTNFDLFLRRRPFSSQFNTYYVINQMSASFDRRLRDISRVGFAALYARTKYGDEIRTTLTGNVSVNCPIDPDVPNGDQLIRRDTRTQFEGFWEWLIHPRMTLRLTAGRNLRDSNCQNTSYDSNTIGLSYRVGWFD